jgi:hypothetical protein
MITEGSSEKIRDKIADVGEEPEPERKYIPPQAVMGSVAIAEILGSGKDGTPDLYPGYWPHQGVLPKPPK